MKRRSIVIAVAAVVLLVGWVVWLFGHSTGGGGAGVSQSAATPAESAGPDVAVVMRGTGGGSGTPVVVTPTPMAVAPASAGMAKAVTPAPSVAALATPPIVRAPPTSREVAMVELQKVHTMIGSYHTLMGQNPVGTNAEIMKALMGGNPHQAMLGPPPGQSLNPKGELLDPWGTPYFFHQMSGDDMEIHSAGPDKVMGTGDDLVIH